MITVATRSCHNHGASTNGSLFLSMFTRTTASMAVPLSVRALSGGLLRLWRTLAVELFFHLRLMDNGSRRLALASCHHSQDLATTYSVLTRLPVVAVHRGRPSSVAFKRITSYGLVPCSAWLSPRPIVTTSGQSARLTALAIATFNLFRFKGSCMRTSCLASTMHAPAINTASYSLPLVDVRVNLAVPPKLDQRATLSQLDYPICKLLKRTCWQYFDGAS
ncbi:hypothetical protein C8Q72DRAFT_857206 [Fomitopsis betulina]|nr:hypothetical protein C8Q72DRAFT_857206 [Fomitopsis betulina]